MELMEVSPVGRLCWAGRVGLGPGHPTARLGCEVGAAAGAPYAELRWGWAPASMVGASWALLWPGNEGGWSLQETGPGVL